MIALSAVTTGPRVGAAAAHSVPWASLGVVRPSLIQPAGWGGPIAAQPKNAAFGWCAQNGIETASTSGTPTLVSDRTVGSMLDKAHLLPPGLISDAGIVASCDAVALDPSHPKTVYAGFDASPNGSIPPVYDVALVTSNMGRSWRYVPPPRGYARTDFAGFVERPGHVELLYAPNVFFPMKSGQTASFVTTSSTNGGRTWTDARLGCPSRTRCVIFGPQAPADACGMSEWQQSVLVNVNAANTTAPRWRPAGSVASVNQCGNQQLIATDSGDNFLIDRSRSSALRYTRDGTHWTTVSLPKLDGQPVSSYPYIGRAMTLAANGDLVAISGTPEDAVGRLEILAPRSKQWCAVHATLPAATATNPVSAILSSATRLVVTFSSPIRSARGNEITALTFPLSTLTCRT